MRLRRREPHAVVGRRVELVSEDEDDLVPDIDRETANIGRVAGESVVSASSTNACGTALRGFRTRVASSKTEASEPRWRTLGIRLPPQRRHAAAHDPTLFAAGTCGAFADRRIEQVATDRREHRLNG